MAGAPGRRLALVTGASAGMGEAFARAYAARGLDVALVARRQDRLESLAAELRSRHSVEALVIPMDLARLDADREVLNEVADAGRHVDVLVNNAGFSIAQKFVGVPWARQRDFLMTLVVNACGLAHGVIPGMIERGGGAIITVASLAGLAPGAVGHSLYPGAKSLAIKFTESLDAEYRDKGLKVTAICPGSTLTEFALANGTQAIMDEARLPFVQTAQRVVEIAIRANERGRVVVVPGWPNKVAASLMRYLPESLVRSVLRRATVRYYLEE